MERCPGQTGKDGRVNVSQRVLVIGGVSDTATVLQAVFEPRGATVERSRTHRPSPANTRFSSEVIVIDLDAEQDFEPQADCSLVSSRILIGSDTPKRIAPDERFLSKPFQYPELVKAIEELLSTRPAA
jgi:hypothetical protein